MTSNRLWGIVLGGPVDDARASLARGLHRRGSRTSRHALFRQAIDRASRVIDTERLVAVLDRDHARSYDGSFAGVAGIQRVVQPRYRGSGPEVFLPLLKIAHQDPDATVVLLPGDMLVDGEARLMNSVAKAAQAAAAKPDLPLVIGAQPAMPDGGAAWIEPGAPVDGLEAFAVRTVARFVIRPSPSDLAALYEGDGLINTRIVVAKVRALIGLGERYLPDVLETFEPLTAAFGAPEEGLLCEAVYEGMPYASVAHALFVRAHHMAVVPTAHVTMWTEAATPRLERLAS